MEFSNKHILLVLFITLITGGCATTAIYTDISRDVDFSQYHTYAWLPPNGDSTATSLFDNEIINEKIMADVNEEMKMRGFKIDADNPDILVLTHTSFEKKTKQELEPIYSSYDYYYPDFYYAGPWFPYYYTGYPNITRISGYDLRTIEYTEGIVAVDIIETADSKLVWRGWVEDKINRKTLSDDLNDYVKNIFERFPLKPSMKNGGMVSK